MRIIAGALGGRNLKTVEGPGYRPATAKVREAIFSMLSSRGVVWSGLRVLDLFAGSGSLSFEALSRGAQEVCLVEREPKVVQCLNQNVEALDVSDRCRVAESDVLRFFGAGRISRTMSFLPIRRMVKIGWSLRSRPL